MVVGYTLVDQLSCVEYCISTFERGFTWDFDGLFVIENTHGPCWLRLLFAYLVLVERFIITLPPKTRNP